MSVEADGNRADFLRPGFTQFDKRRGLLTYDLTPWWNCAAKAENQVAAFVSPAWYADGIGGAFGQTPAFAARLKLTYADGASEVVETGTDWTAAYDTPYLRTGIYEGELYDARHERDAFACAGKTAAVVVSAFKGTLEKPRGAEVHLRRDLALAPVEAYVWRGTVGAAETNAFGRVKVLRRYQPGEPMTLQSGEQLVLDFGQNAAAIPEVVAKAAAGVTLTVKGRDYRVTSTTYEEARRLLEEARLKANVERVHARSKNRFGYLNIDAMNRTSLLRFQREAYAEGYGREGLIIDVRTNHGGNTADQMLSSLFDVRNGCAVTRDGRQGYITDWAKEPIWTKPIVVLCSEESGSNAEMFSHTIKFEKRGKLVGRETGGNVICTFNDSVLDYGEFRNPYLGIFCLDGRDMEHNGAKPDVVVDNQPAAIVKGVDEQLEKAIDVLTAEVEAWKKANPPLKPVYAK